MLNDRKNFYHVLHFDGHGAFPPGADPRGLLLFEGEGDEPRRMTGAELGGLLAGKGVPAVLLNACQSGMTHPEALYPSVANELLKAGTGGVVAMAYSVYVQSAVRFMARRYEGLIKGDELARAVAAAREDLRAHPQRMSPISEIPLRDWVVPVLFEAAPVRVTSRPLGELHLSPSLLQDRQATPGAEIDLPEPPAFGFVGRDGVVLVIQGRWVEWERIVDEIEAVSTDIPGEPLKGRENLWLGLLGHQVEIAEFRHDYAAAWLMHSRLKDHYERAGDESNLSVSLHQLGVVAQRRWQFDEAERWHWRSLSINERIGDEHGQATSLHELGMIAEERGDILEAAKFCERSEALLTRLSDLYNLEIVRASLRRVRKEEG